MSDSRQQLEAFLHAQFPALSLHRVTARDGAFPSLRFELGGGLPYDSHDERDKRVEHSASLAASIFETAFEPADDGFISFTRWEHDDDALFLGLLPPGSDVTRSQGEDFYEQDEPDTPYVTHTARLRPRSIDYPSLFTLIASSDLRPSRSPSVAGRCYLVNTRTPLIFHMYDDRGAMLVASTDGDLDAVRERHGNLIIP